MNTRNSTNIVWVDTHRVTLAEYEADVSYHSDELGQGDNATNPVPAFSMYAGKPDQDDVDSNTRAIFWRSYTATVALVIVCVILLANWPE